MPFVQVAIPSPLYQCFDYLCEQLPPIGSRVAVPFGFRNTIGIVIGHREYSDIPAEKLKAIIQCLDQQAIFPADLLQLLTWVANYYHHPLGDVFATALPSALRQGKTCQLAYQTFWRLQQTMPCRGKKQQLAMTLLASGEQTSEQLQRAGISQVVLKNLLQKGAIKKRQHHYTIENQYQKETTVTLNIEQADVLCDIQQHYQRFQVMLLQGVTGSGKTEVYIHSIQPLIEQGKQALILVPEIGLTPQLLQRFQTQLSARILAYHSNLTQQQQQQAWCLIQQGLADVVIGTRSAVFLPFQQLAMIVVDEEHDLSFKQMDGLRYHARDLAIRRAQLNHIPIILGSATPSLESLYNVKQQRYQFLQLQQRAGKARLPDYEIIALRQQHMQHGLSDALIQAITSTVENKQQVLLFLNRRGYSPVFMCHDCAWMATCVNCDAYLTLHQQPRYLHCHHCDKSYQVFKHCPECHSENLHSVGEGTQRIEQAIEQLFPAYNIVRVDRDVTRRKGEFEQKLEQIHSGNANILIGTQMLAKGHHFPNVTLVAVINADNSFYSIDFRAIETIGQLLVQVAGRAGRAEKPGKVIIQSYQPDNPFLQTLVQHGYPAFAKSLLADRQLARLPPYEYAILLRAENKKANVALAFLKTVLKATSPIADVRIYGPIQANMERRAGWYRAQLLLQSAKRKALHQFAASLVSTICQQKPPSGLRWSIDVDPRD